MASPKTNEEKVLAQIKKAHQSVQIGKLQPYQVTWSYLVNMLPKVPSGSIGVSIGRLLRAGAIKAHEKIGMSTYYAPTPGIDYSAPGRGRRSDLMKKPKDAPKKPQTTTPTKPRTTRKKAT